MEKLIKYFVIAGALISGRAPEAQCQQLSPPVFGCIQVADNGNATLNWIPASDPGNNFVQYDIYVSNNAGGAYSLLASPNSVIASAYVQSTTSTFTDNYFYYLQTISTNGSTNFTSTSSDTLSSIWLAVTASSTGYAQLNWNSPFLNSVVVQPGLNYEIWREYPIGNWQMVQTMPFGVTNANYEIVDVCSAVMNFRVRLALPSGCFFSSNIAGGTFDNYAPPAIPVLTSVSIDHVLNRSVIEWEPSTSPDTQAYIIYKCVNGNTLIVDTIWGINTTQFTDLLSGTAVNTGPVSYSIAAFDGCYHGSPASPNTSALAFCQSSVFVPQIGYAYCSSYVIFQWTAYQGWDFGVDSYVIYHAIAPEQNTPYANLVFSPIDTVAGNVLNYNNPIAEYNVYHCYYIVAIGTATEDQAPSNYTRVLTPYPVEPAYLYLGSSTVTTQDSTLTLIEIQPTPNIFEMKLERFDHNNLEWDAVIVVESTASGATTIPDALLKTDVFSYTYRVITSNFCGDVIDTTNIGKTILLSGLANQQRIVNTLVWTAYEAWDHGASMYRIHRIIGRTGADEVIAEINPSAQYFYEDDVSSLLFTEGRFCYRIEAVEAPSALGSHSSFSNEICLAQKPVIWIPNSFVVDGYNSTFSPVISFADFTRFKMLIYSRWGDVIYETTDINKPWDGSMKGKTVQEGTYTYFISVKDGEGREYNYTGYVIMLVGREK